jgi:hypothetical protein
LVVTITTHFKPFMDAITKTINQVNAIIESIGLAYQEYTQPLEAWENEGGALDESWWE